MTWSRRGVALFLILWLVVALGAIGAVVVRDARGAGALALNAKARLIARAAAESGIEALVAGIEDTLALLAFGMERRDWLNALEDGTGRGDTLVLGDGRVAWAALDVNARLDVNAATAEALMRFFSQFTGPSAAADIARDIRLHIGGTTIQATGVAPMPGEARLARPLRSVDELATLRLVPGPVLEQAAVFLTVDGDGTINQRRAPDEVLRAVAGELRDEPTRLLLVSRGWMANHAMTHEIQAVFDIQVDRLSLVHWRERVL